MSYYKCICLINHHLTQDIEYLCHLQKAPWFIFWVDPVFLSGPENHWSAFYHCRLVVSFPGLHINRIVWYVPFLSPASFFQHNSFLKKYPSMSLYVSVVSFHYWIVFHCMDMRQLIHSPVGGQLLVSSLGLLMNKAAIINEQVCCEYICAHHCVSICFWFSWTNKRGAARSCDQCPFNFTRNCQSFPEWLYHFAFQPLM